MTGLASIPRAQRLVDVLCPQRHLAAILMRNAGLDPFLAIEGQGGPSPQYVLTSTGLCAAMTGTGEGGNARIWALGDGLTTALLMCPHCVADYQLDSATLAAKAAQGRPGVSVARLTLGAP